MARQQAGSVQVRGASPLRAFGAVALPAARPYWICLVLWITLGWSGAHRFYTGRWITGLLYLLTLGLFGAGWAADLFLLRRMLLRAPHFNLDSGPHLAPWSRFARPARSSITSSTW